MAFGTLYMESIKTIFIIMHGKSDTITFLNNK